jgi:hypothetical protein
MKEFYVCKHAPFVWNMDTLSVIGSIFWNWPVCSRFGILNEKSPMSFKPMDKPLPCGNVPKETMEELCVIVAKELLDKYPDRQLAVFWSGGVDSTTIISSLLLAGCPKEKLIILYTPSSIDEYKLFYDYLLHNKFRMIRFHWTKLEELLKKFKDVVFITGWCADQLFGSNVNLSFPQYYDKPFKDTFKDFIHIRKFYEFDDNNNDKLADILDEYEDFGNKIGLPIKYTCEALWLYNFAIKWSHVSMDLKLSLDNDEQRNRVINFFEDIRFQEWSMSNYKNLIKANQITNPKAYKRELKNVIYSFNKDQEYLDTKGKVNSWKHCDNTGKVYSKFCILDDDGYHTSDLETTTEWSKVKCKVGLERQEINRRYLFKDYIKDWVDMEKYRTIYWKVYHTRLNGYQF